MIIRHGIDKALNRKTVRFFMPGHIGEKDISLHYDVTELNNTDNLRQPNGIIKDAQLSAGTVFGARETFFLVNGSSVGLHALLMSVCNRGDTLIVDRGCHISVINAMILNDIRPVFIYPMFNNEFGINSGINPDDIELAFNENPKAKAVLITSPTYYGICSDLEAIGIIAHRRNAALIVDEAHGAHFAFNHNLPKTALSCGADGAVQSAHKTLPCITQGALLHIGTERIKPQEVLENLNLLQTTSPSYLIMMSIDESVSEMKKIGKENLDRIIKECDNLREAVSLTGKYKCLKSDDPTRIVINAGDNAASVQCLLKNKFNIEIEMCDGYNLVMIAKSRNKTSDFKKLKTALIKISYDLPILRQTFLPSPPRTCLKHTPTQAYYSKTELLEPICAVGRISARCIYKMPPCMSIVCPGEIITKDIANSLNEKILVTKE